jgi:hypothetical protein
MRVLVLGIAIIGIGLLSAASAEAQSGGPWTPRCETPKSTNCYIWLLNPNNGLYDHIYQGGPPNCSKGPPGGYDPSQNPACEARGGNTPSGNGGPSDTYDNSPCDNVSSLDEEVVVRYAADVTVPATPLAPGTYCVFTRGLNGTRGPLVGMASVTRTSGRGRLLAELQVVLVTVNQPRRIIVDLRRTNDLPIANKATALGGQPGMRYDTAAQYQARSSEKGTLPIIAFVHNYDNQNNVVSFDAYYATSTNVPLEQRSVSQTWISKQFVLPTQ